MERERSGRCQFFPGVLFRESTIKSVEAKEREVERMTECLEAPRGLRKGVKKPLKPAKEGSTQTRPAT
jgi:hypothetical protein